MKLRRPQDKLAGCVWLPRFIDKARHYFAGTLDKDYQGAFCNPLGIDGVFFVHFGLKKDEILQVIQSERSDENVAAWFTAGPGSSDEKIRIWNEIAPHIGEAGFPGERMFRWGLKHIYRGCIDPRVTSGFTAIAWDEGFLDEIVPKEPNKAPTRTAPSGTSPAGQEPCH